MRSLEKRVLHEERRPQIRTAADLLGPGFGPYAVQISDWNAEETTFNGLWWSEAGALNSPDPAKQWMGNSEGNSDGTGTEHVVEVGPAAATPPAEYTRGFTSVAGGRSYAAWARTGGLPAGMLMPYAGIAPPGTDEWLVADGSAVSRDIYDRLFAAIGTTYGGGDGSTTFNLPNMKGRVPVGLDPAQAEFDALGGKGGEKEHTLTYNETGIHNHGGDTGSASAEHHHDLGMRWNDTAVGGGANKYVSDINGQSGASGGNAATASTQDAGGTHTHPIPDNTGGDPHNNLQPFITVGYLIKT